MVLAPATLPGRPIEAPGSVVLAAAEPVDRPAIPARELAGALEDAWLLGRGGAGFPVGRKWKSLAARDSGSAVVVANGAEGEPASGKDRMLMLRAPDLVLDGARLAAEAIGADEIVVYVGSEHDLAKRSMARAIEARRGRGGPPLRLVEAPVSYVAGEASAAVHCINDGEARPTASPPRPSTAGVGGRPTLVQNVESLVWAALIARYGPAWYARAGRATTPGAAFVTLSGAVERPGVRQIELGTTVRELVEDAGGRPRDVSAVILGGYFGTWATVRDAMDLALDPTEMQGHGLAFGCGIVGLLRHGDCGVAATARILQFLASESAGQCGPCVWGLRSIADTLVAVAAGKEDRDAVENLERWAGLVSGRGACRHPDGAAELLLSALDVFGPDLEAHASSRACEATGLRPRFEP